MRTNPRSFYHGIYWLTKPPIPAASLTTQDKNAMQVTNILSRFP